MGSGSYQRPTTTTTKKVRSVFFFGIQKCETHSCDEGDGSEGSGYDKKVDSGGDSRNVEVAIEVLVVMVVGVIPVVMIAYMMIMVVW